ncbi:Aldo/keto reductase [Apiospora rasikravindrae]|uniref:Aldo/keto reductase n=1 Tax=Apiospora rasikravindrae TaxID=990691 RepID=A0ABR1TDU6_9PEZI
MASPKAPQLIFGCGGLGHEISADSAAELLQTLKAGGVTRLDTAALYPPTDVGASQRVLGQTRASAELGFTIDTKVMVSISGLAGTLEPAKIETSAAQSVKDLGFSNGGGKINVFYAHAPDVATPLADQAAAFDAQYKKGIFKQLGLCNFPAPMLEEYIAICEREGYIKPSVYQGLYNLIDRRHEGAVMDLVRQHNMTFVAHSPHAGGFLHGGLTSGRVEGTRFAAGNIMSMDARRYDTEKHHAAVRAMDKALEPHDGLDKTDVAMRWLAFHSRLGPDDAIIFGASKIEQAKRTVAAVTQGPLPDDIVAALDEMWMALVAA